MSGSDLRPKSYGWVDKNNVNSYAVALDIPEAASGYNDGAIPPAKKYNMVMQRHAGWAAHLDGRAMRSEHIMGSVTCRISSGSFAFTPAVGLTHPVAADSAYVINGYIVDLPVSRLVNDGLSPFVFTASKWTHWYIDKDGVSFSIVNIGVAAAPAAGQAHLGTAVTSAVALTGWVAGSSSFTDRRVLITPTLRTLGTLDVVGAAQFSSTAQFSGGTTFNAASGWSVNSPTAAILVSQLGTGPGIQLLSSTADRLLDIISSGSGAAMKAVNSGSGYAIWGIGNGSSSTAFFENSDDQYAVEAISGPNASYAAGFFGNPSGDASGVYMRGHGEGSGGYAESGTTNGAVGFEAQATNSTGHGIVGRTNTSATTAARGGYFVGRDSAAGLEAESALYYAAVITPKVAAPTYGAMLFATQLAAPTDFSSGSLAYTSALGFCHGSFSDSGYRSFWSTLGGFCYGHASGGPTTNSNNAVYTQLCSVTLSNANAPKLAGKSIRITVLVRLGTAAGTATYADIQVRDSVAGILMTRAGNGLLVGSGYYIPAIAGDWSATASFEFEYAVPLAGSRTIILEFKRNAAVTVYAHGTLTVQGMY